MHCALVVDDNPDIRTLLGQALEMEGYEVHQAENGLAAQEKLVQGLRPCVVVLDIMMPVMDGHQFLSWKTRQADVAKIPVLVISAVTTGSPLQGATAFLKKPIDLDDVLTQVHSLCERK